MWISIVLFVIGFGLLIKGADILVDGSVSIAHKFGVSTFVIGLTVVAFGTSAPELFVSFLASIQGSAGIAFGNIIGSNITNSLLILGVAAIIAPILIKKNTINKEIPFSLLAIFAFGVLVNDKLINRDLHNYLTRIDGIILILFFFLFIYYTFGIAKNEENIIKKTINDFNDELAVEYNIFKSILMVIIGLSALALGGRWIVNGAITFATYFKISEAFIGLTIVAIGTSLPELAASVVAARKGNTDLAVGNVIGSNVFNLLWVLGISSTISPIEFDSTLNIDLGILAAVTVLLLFLIYYGKKNILARGEGAIMIGLYFTYLVFITLRG